MIKREGLGVRVQGKEDRSIEDHVIKETKNDGKIIVVNGGGSTQVFVGKNYVDQNGGSVQVVGNDGNQ